ncbi:MAG: tripartite tricarboxylate transporter substrate-binding protein [Pseudomonadota bacterium]
MQAEWRCGRAQGAAAVVDPDACRTHEEIKVSATPAIAAYLNALKSGSGLLSSGRAARARCRAICGEMQLPSVPPIAKTLPGYEFTAWFAVVAPKGTNAEIIAKLNEQFRKAMSSPEFVKRFEAEGLEVIGSTPEQLAAHLDSELKKWARVIKERKMKAE